MLPRVANLQPDSFLSARLAFAQNVPISATGDVLINGASPLFIAASLFNLTPASIVVWNPLVNGVSGDLTSGALGIWTGPGQTGTAIVNNLSLTINGVTGATGRQSLALAVSGAFTFAGPTAWYLNVGTAVAGGTLNVAVFGQVLQN